MRIPLKFNIYSISNVRYSDCRLKSHRIVHRAMLLSASVTSASSKKMHQRWICFQRWFSMATKFVIFSPENHPHHLHFRSRNSLTGWTITKIFTSFHHALMAPAIRWSAMENFNISPPAVRGLKYKCVDGHMSTGLNRLLHFKFFFSGFKLFQMYSSVCRDSHSLSTNASNADPQ